MSKHFIQSWIHPNLRQLPSYHVPPSNGCLKLDAMENPYSLSKDLIKKHTDCLAKAALNRYPDPDANLLKQSLRLQMGINKECDLLLGNGSDELIQLLCLACSPNEVVMSPAPSFVMYQMIATFTHLKYVDIPLDKDFSFNIKHSLALVDKHRPKLIFIAYPNNPTGNLFNKQDLITLIKNTTALVVIDEAYYAYADDDFLSQLTQFDNLVIIRTVSKIGLAGLRLGLLIANKPMIAQLDKLRLPYNINTLTQLSAQFLLDNFDELGQQTKKIIAQRNQMMLALDAFDEIITYSTQANFILFKVSNANDLFNYLLENNILIKNLSAQVLLTNCLRLTIGTPQENDLFVQTLTHYYAH